MDISFACQLLSVPLSSYHSWLKAKPVADKDSELLQQVKQAFEVLKGNGSSRSIKAYLWQQHQLKASRRRTAKLLKKLRFLFHNLSSLGIEVVSPIFINEFNVGFNLVIIEFDQKVVCCC